MKITDSEKIFTSMGFNKKTWVDKNGVNDKFYTLLFVEYFRVLADNLQLCVVFGYDTVNEDNQKLFQTTVEIQMRTEYCKLDVKHFAHLKKIIETLKII
jgi:hypothetical protein